MKIVFLSGVAWICSIGSMMAQTTLSGDHVITGDLDVGTTGTPGSLEVSGETGNLASAGIIVTGDGGVLFSGTLGIGQIPATGEGARFMWYPGKGALRVGVLASGSYYSNLWNNNYIGIGSVAFSNSRATGDYSTAMSGGVAEGRYSTAMSGGQAVMDHSTAFSSSFSEGIGATSMSGGYSGGGQSVGMSAGGSYADYSTAMSKGYAGGINSVAMSGGESEGDNSIAMSGGITFGAYSTAAGRRAVAMSYNSFTIGQYNSITGSENALTWVSTDPLFVVGNGSGVSSDPPAVKNRNAFVIYKNGDARFTKRQGDILMGEFGNPE